MEWAVNRRGVAAGSSHRTVIFKDTVVPSTAEQVCHQALHLATESSEDS